MNVAEQMNREAVLVREIAANVHDVMDGEWDNREWLHLFADFEIDARGERMSAICFALARHADRPVEKIAFRFPFKAKQMLAAIADDMTAHGKDRWTAARIRIERDGGWTIDYVHDAPYRLGTTLNDVRYVGYREQWLGSDAGAPYREVEPSAPQKWLGGKDR